MTTGVLVNHTPFRYASIGRGRYGLPLHAAPPPTNASSSIHHTTTTTSSTSSNASSSVNLLHTNSSQSGGGHHASPALTQSSPGVKSLISPPVTPSKASSAIDIVTVGFVIVALFVSNYSHMHASTVVLDVVAMMLPAHHSHHRLRVSLRENKASNNEI
jgi:hypothetical protein